jgi:hypothetical protein
LRKKVIPSLINIHNCPIGIERNERAAMYAKIGNENDLEQRAYMMHTHHVMQRLQSNGLIGLRFLALSSLVNADLQDSVNPERSTM